jgi:hypothetical protein
MAGIYSNRGKSGERTIKAGIGYKRRFQAAWLYRIQPAKKKRKCRDGMALQKKMSDRNPKKMRRLYRLIGIDEEHCCRDTGIVPVAGLL